MGSSPGGTDWPASPVTLCRGGEDGSRWRNISSVCPLGTGSVVHSKLLLGSWGQGLLLPQVWSSRMATFRTYTTWRQAWAQAVCILCISLLCLYNVSFGDEGRCHGEVQRPLQRPEGEATRHPPVPSCDGKLERRVRLALAWQSSSLLTLGSLTSGPPHHPEVASIHREGRQHGYQTACVPGELRRNGFLTMKLEEMAVSRSWDESQLFICQGR